MKVCFHHDPFDIDVSSGTIHALHQWFELLQGFGVSECAIINRTTEVLPKISSTMKVHEFTSLSEFEERFGNERLIHVERGGPNYRYFDIAYNRIDWLVFGGTEGLPRADIGIRTQGTVALYPREAAAIILSHLS